MRIQKYGQLWTGDLILSLLIFMVASVIAFTIIYNTLDQDSYNDVRLEAVGAATLLSQEGYPQHWTNTTVIRPGLVSNDRLSVRKVSELAGIDTARLRTILRLTDQFAIVFQNQSNATVALAGACSIGDAAIMSTAMNVSLAAVAISHTTTLTSQLNMTQITDDTIYNNLTAQDFVLIEGNLTSNVSKQQLMLFFNDASNQGMTFVIVGNPGVPILGLNINTSNVTNASVQGNGAQFGFQTNEQLNISATNLLAPTLDTPIDAAVSQYTPIVVVNNSKALYATWLYNDARVWYLAVPNGTLQNGSSILPTLAKNIDAMHIVSQPSCGSFTPPADAKQVAFYTRTFLYHQQLLNMQLSVWRTR